MEDKTVKALKAHLAINVRSVESSIEFYKRMFGIEPSKVRAGYAKFDVQNPPLNLTLNEIPFRERGALSHLGIQVASTEDVLRMRERWAAVGLVTQDEMQTNCCFALQDKTWVRDPDGNEWEAFVVLEDNLAETTLCCTTDSTEAAQHEGTSACATGNPATTAKTVSAATPSGCCDATPTAPLAISR